MKWKKNLPGDSASRHVRTYFTGELFRCEDDPARAAVEKDIRAAVDGETNILHHLAGIHLEHQKAPSPSRVSGKRLFRKGKERNRAEHADLPALTPEFLDSGKCDPCCDAKSDND